MDYRILGNRVLIKPDPKEYQGLTQKVVNSLKQGTLVLPDSYEGIALKVSPKGTVVKLGRDCKQNLKIGDKVFYSQFSFSKFEDSEDGLRIVLEDDIQAVIEDA